MIRLTPQDGFLRPEPDSESLPTAEEAARIRAEGAQNLITISAVNGPFQSFRWAKFDGICAELERPEYRMRWAFSEPVIR
jgi:hypothetical protein